MSETVFLSAFLGSLTATMLSSFVLIFYIRKKISNTLTSPMQGMFNND